MLTSAVVLQCPWKFIMEGGANYCIGLERPFEMCNERCCSLYTDTMATFTLSNVGYVDVCLCLCEKEYRCRIFLTIFQCHWRHMRATTLITHLLHNAAAPFRFSVYRLRLHPLSPYSSSICHL